MDPLQKEGPGGPLKEEGPDGPLKIGGPGGLAKNRRGLLGPLK